MEEFDEPITFTPPVWEYKAQYVSSDAIQLHELLDSLGKDSWELISVISTHSDAILLLILKRFKYE